MDCIKTMPYQIIAVTQNQQWNVACASVTKASCFRKAATCWISACSPGDLKKTISNGCKQQIHNLKKAISNSLLSLSCMDCSSAVASHMPCIWTIGYAVGKFKRRNFDLWQGKFGRAKTSSDWNPSCVDLFLPATAAAFLTWQRHRRFALKLATEPGHRKERWFQPKSGNLWIRLFMSMYMKPLKNTQGCQDCQDWHLVWKVHCLAHAVFCFVPLGPRPMSISSESWRMTEKHGEVKEETFRNHLSHRHTPLKLSAAASTRHSGHSPLLLGRSSLPLASLQTPKMPRGSFHQALWPQAYAPKTLRGSFHQALKPHHARTTFGSWDDISKSKC